MHDLLLALVLIGLATASAAAAAGGCQPARESVQELAATAPAMEADPYAESAVDATPRRAVVIYTRENAPAAPRLEALPLKESVSQYGITWSFEKPARVGQFLNGDWYVVGPVTVAAISPRPLYGREIPESELDPMDKERPVEQ